MFDKKMEEKLEELFQLFKIAKERITSDLKFEDYIFIVWKFETREKAITYEKEPA